MYIHIYIYIYIHIHIIIIRLYCYVFHIVPPAGRRLKVTGRPAGAASAPPSPTTTMDSKAGRNLLGRMETMLAETCSGRNLFGRTETSLIQIRSPEGVPLKEVEGNDKTHLLPTHPFWFESSTRGSPTSKGEAVRGQTQRPARTRRTNATYLPTYLSISLSLSLSIYIYRNLWMGSSSWKRPSS